MASLRRFNSSLDVVAARSPFNGHGLRPSGTDYAQEMTGMPSFTRSASAGPIMKGPRTRSTEPLRDMSNQSVKGNTLPPLNVKKLRRRALISGVALVLPESPIVPPVTGSTPSTSFTFTASWDANLHEFSFTPVTPHTPCPSPGLRLVASPIPYDVDTNSDDVESSNPSVHASHPRRSFSTSSSSSSSTQPDSLFLHSRTTSAASSVSTAPSVATYEPHKLPSTSSLSPPPIIIDFSDYGIPHSAYESSIGTPKQTSDKVYDDDALNASWSAFEQSCWESLDQPFSVQLQRPYSYAPRIHHQRKSSSESGKPLPDVPVDCSFFDEVRRRRVAEVGQRARSDSLAQNDLSPVRSTHSNSPPPSLGQWMRARFHKLFGNTHRHPS